MVGKAGPESFADKTMADPGKATVNVSNSMADEWSFLYHNDLLVEENSYQTHQATYFHIFEGGNEQRPVLFFRNIGKKVVVSVDFQRKVAH